MTVSYQKAPFPWFGGKSKAAPVVWDALGDVAHYVEPFAGTLAVLLNRPHPCNRSYYSETVNDMDGLLVNAWRSIQHHPELTAEWASWPVTECDKHARQVALMRWREEMQLEHLMGDPEWCDPKMAGWWLWGICTHIGGGWCTGEGPWTADETGRLVKQAKPGKGQREPGVSRKIPHLSDNGSGVHHAGLREPGVRRSRPHLTDNGSGVHHAGLREPGVNWSRTHLTGNGRGVHHAGTREPGVLSHDPANEFHPLTMPELIRWFQWLSARLRHVRIINGDWRRVCTSGAAKMLQVRSGKGVAGFFLDPPYSAEAGRADGLYTAEDLSVAHAVREWCAANGDDPDYRIVLAGFDGEHNDLEARGWRAVEWFKSGFLQGGYAQQKRGGGTQQHRERLWLSPHCLVSAPVQFQQAEMLG